MILVSCSHSLKCIFIYLGVRTCILCPTCRGQKTTCRNTLSPCNYMGSGNQRSSVVVTTISNNGVISLAMIAIVITKMSLMYLFLT